ncbi:DUF4255 domain-containing protein [Pantanalinema rosaneae CENA516]|uniref:DUF4255 domain-containing protein n=1 Tax=Pantanalinema rosaneae TaxID=1620701 RepID=UPI003D6FF27E
MANLEAIHSVGNSLITYLRNVYEAAPEEMGLPACEFRLLSSTEMNNMEDPTADSILSLYLHRATINPHLRNSRPVDGRLLQPVPLSVDLHYLMTVWARDVQPEHVILAWAMRQLHFTPVLDRSFLSEEANWDAGELVQVIPSELSNEDMMRVWDTLKPSYHLTVSYVARVVRIEADRAEEARPVVATRFGLTEEGAR